MNRYSDLDHLMTSGWFRMNLDHDDSVAAEVIHLRNRCATEFRRLMGEHRIQAATLTPTGQYGFTQDGDESTTEVREIRSHLIFNQVPPADHPLADLSPMFYGQSIGLRSLTTLEDYSAHLSELLDLLALETVERIEERLGLRFGSIAGGLAMGERLLRYQWYPAIPGGRNVNLDVTGAFGTVKANGKELLLAGKRVEVMRATPHYDIGHWTWQVYASNSGLFFLDPLRNQPVEAPAGPWIYGNVCEFLELDHPEVHAPMHWVDIDPSNEQEDRISISYFVHTRPSVRCHGIPSGLLLYDRLLELGYATSQDRSQVERILAQPGLSDHSLVNRITDWESANTRQPRGFTYTVKRYLSP